MRYGSTRVRYQRPSLVCTSRSIGLEVFEHLLGVLHAGGRRRRLLVISDSGRPTSDGQQIEDVAGARRGQLHAQQPIEEDRADLGGVDQVLEVVVRERQLLDLDLQLLVDRRELLVDRLQLLLARLELLGGGPQLLVDRLQLLVRRLGLLRLRLVLIDRACGAAP